MAKPWGAAVRRVCRLVLVAPASVLAVAVFGVAPASAQLPPSSDPLPGSSVQGADGDQDDGNGFRDWEFLQAADRVRHSPDPNALDSAFKGGNAGKENAPGDWDLRTEADGVRPPKANIRDAWSAVGQPGADTFLYLAFTRESDESTLGRGGGTTFVTFELNRDDRLWNNGQADVPCRRTGDIQVAYEVQGNDMTVVLRRWTTTATDDATGCATEGHLDNFSDFTPNEDVQGAVNATSIASHLPGAYEGTVPAQRFGEAALNLTEVLQEGFHDRCIAFGSVWMYSRSSNQPNSNMQDYIAPHGLSVRTCAASGTKFFDSNANGVRDDGERGIPRFVIWADYDHDGVRDDNEPFSVSDRQGHYVIYDIRHPYTLREELLTRRSRLGPVAGDWVCSAPATQVENGRFHCASGEIDPNLTPNATGHDFGNWFPARLTLKKVVGPPDDPGQFDLRVDSDPKLEGARNGDEATLRLPPGTYDIDEVATPNTGTVLANYESDVRCRRFPSRPGGKRSGTAYPDLALTAGMTAKCTFFNIRPGSPAIEIVKTGPLTATAGDTLHYTLDVTNIGDIPFPADAVHVTDETCDDPPELVSKNGDSSPGTLDPDETWTYRCSHKTSAGGDDCLPTRVNNTGVVMASPVSDDDSISTIILCPDKPNPPIPVPPGPGPGPRPGPAPQPGPVVPPGPRPLDAGDAGVAGVLFKRATQGCIGTRVPRVAFRGTRIRRIRVFVNGREDRRLTVRTLQRLVFRPRVRLGPGSYRVRVRVVFQRGSGTPPLTLRGRIAICGQVGPRFTG